MITSNEEQNVGRFKLGSEGNFEIPTAFIVEGAIEWDEDGVPFGVDANFENPPMGRVINIIREDNRDITGEFVFRPDCVKYAAAMTAAYGAAMYITNIESHTFKGVRFITGGILRYSFWTYDVPWAPMFDSMSYGEQGEL